MARQTQQQRIDELLGRYDETVRDAFLESIRDIVDRVRLAAIITALERGDIEGAVRATNVEAAAFQPLDTAIRAAFVEGGTTTAATMPVLREPDGAPIVFRFDVRMPAAETWLANHSSQAITEIVEDQRIAIRAALTEGMVKGANPRMTALDVVGRVNAATGRREGGFIGLSAPQERYAAAARAELSSGDPALMRKYLDRGRRDARFDGVVRKAIKEGKTLDAATVSRLAGRYADRLLALRGEIIGRTESMTAINTAQFQTYQQAESKGGLHTRITKGWKATLDGRERNSHHYLNGVFVGLNDRFSNGLLYPHDPSGDISERAGCRCRPVFRINRFANLT